MLQTDSRVKGAVACCQGDWKLTTHDTCPERQAGLSKSVEGNNVKKRKGHWEAYLPKPCLAPVVWSNPAMKFSE